MGKKEVIMRFLVENYPWKGSSFQPHFESYP